MLSGYCPLNNLFISSNSGVAGSNLTRGIDVRLYLLCVGVVLCDRLCSLLVKVPGYRSRGPGSIPGTTKKKVVGLERDPLSLVSTTEELLDRKVAAPVQKTENTALGIRHADHVAPSIRKLVITSPTSGGRSVGIVRSRTQTMEFCFFGVVLCRWRGPHPRSPTVYRIKN
jgi:hypothetical protein